MDDNYSLLEERRIRHTRVCADLARLAYAVRAPDKAPFTLASGASTHEYIDCRKALSHAGVLSAVCDLFAVRLLPQVTAVGGMTMGADPLAIGTVLAARHAARTWFSVRKQRKDHGTSSLIEGAVMRLEHVCIVEDTVTTGSSVIQAIHACQDAGLRVDQVLVLVDREEGGLARIKACVPDARVVALYTKTEIADAYARAHR